MSIQSRFDRLLAGPGAACRAAAAHASSAIRQASASAATAAVTAFLASGVAHSATSLADQPVFTSTSVPGNLALVLSVEYPTAVSVAHLDSTINTSQAYLGYFDPDKCYLYNYDADETQRYFYPAGSATNRTCTNSTWSGNFLNWATMQTIDPFRWALTGGYRSIDTSTLTVIEKAYATGQGGLSNFPDRSVTGSSTVSSITPLNWSNLTVSIAGLGNKMRFTNTGNFGGTIITYQPTLTLKGSKVYEVSVRVKVCDPTTGAGGLESNCLGYPSGAYKPVGLIQQYASKIRFSAFGYLNDGNLYRDGGVLRARQKFVGPTITNPGNADSTNPAAEWDADSGILVTNPDSADATSTASALGVSISNSGVINYLNKFGEVTPGSYKTYDPVGELYYAAVRYFKNLGNVPEYSDMSGASTTTRSVWADGFPVITSWDDPIQYSCQRNFILGIGDVNTHADRNLPGNTAAGSTEPSTPSAVSADKTVDAQVATDKVGSLHGLGSSLGSTTNYGGCCNNNGALIAGLAYDSHTVDIRPDGSDSKTIGLQTISTYWLDVLEYQTYKADNQYYLATKYGGFTLPKGYNPYTQATDIPQNWWSTNGETVGGQPRPDNYFVASKPDAMVSGLTRAFASIAAQVKAYTTSFSTSLPQVSVSGTTSYSTIYDAGTWTGELTASTSTFDATTGDPVTVDAWNFSGKLATQASGTGWDTNRRIATMNTATGLGVPFRVNSVSSTQKTALDTIYRSGDDSSDYLNYLRGDQSQEEASTAAGSSHAYRTRTKLLGDIVGAKARPVAPPAAPLSSAANPGYDTFKSTYSSRQTVVYVGTNNGMMHAVDGSVSSTSGGSELFAYVPGMLYQGPTGSPSTTGLQAIGDPDFTHHPFADGPLAAFDIDFGRTRGGSGTDWRTVLVGALGKGGKGYYAIDVTNPAGMTSETAVAGKVLWEFSDNDLGYTYGEPAAVKTRKYGWVLIFGSGHNNSDGKGYFFIVNPRTGALLEKIGTGAGSGTSPAGMAQVQAFVLDRTDGTADSVYAGDLLGNLWRLDVTSASAGYPSPVKIAQLSDSSGNALPVTSRPLVVVQPGSNRRYVTVGTGRLLDASDVGNTQMQSFFAIIDGTGLAFASSLPTGISWPITRSKLQKLTDLTQRVTLDLTTQMGWFLDLGLDGGGLGWRVISDSTSSTGVVAFATMLPNGQVCNPSGTSRVYAIDLGSGQSRLVSSSTVISYSTALTGVVTDLKFFSVSGKLRLIGGSDTGAARSLAGNWGSLLSGRRLNWRELQLAY